MILGVLRAAWFLLVIGLATLVYGSAALVAALFGVRGRIYVRWSRQWCRFGLWASGSRVVGHGVEHIRPGEPYVLAANHLSWFDVFAVGVLLKVDFYFVAKKELERIPLFGQAWRVAGHISIDRSNRERAIQSLRRASAQMHERKCLVILFVEGTRSRTGRLQPFKKGAFALAAESGIPIIPTVVTGSFGIMRPDTFVVRPSTIHVYFEEPIPSQGATQDELLQRTRAVIVRRLVEAGEPPPLDAAGMAATPDDAIDPE